ncbi:MAG: hypothetical protein HYT80_07250 [Euryarchaeota archaeon]|nr:hypothetical protein [Euryarchaeota archaeon]
MALLDPELFRRQQYGDGFWYLMVGFALVFFDVNVGTLDFLPDPLGFAVIAYGSALLRPLHGWATNAYVIAIGLAVVSGFRLLAALNDVAYSDHVLGRFMELVEAGANVGLIWILFQIVLELAQRLNAPSLGHEAATHRFFLVVLIVGATALGAYFGGANLDLEAGLDTGAAALVLFLMFIVALVLVLRVFLQASNLCRYGRLWPPGERRLKFP